ncbi:MAG: alpha/beta fold hydrolase [Cyanobacteria bacterium J06639_1]
MPLPTVILPGYFAGAEDYRPLQNWLSDRDYPTLTVPLRVSDWFITVGGRPITPIADALARTIAEARSRFDSEQVNLIGHSAGGWIARIFLGSTPYYDNVWNGREYVASLVTLGTPHVSQERWTRFNLSFVNDNYPGAFWPEVKYVCAAGNAVRGRKASWFSRQPWSERLAYSSYELTIGDGEAMGDGITPIAAAHLEGAENLTIDRVCHSPRGDRFWYGSPAAAEQWLEYLQ